MSKAVCFSHMSPAVSRVKILSITEFLVFLELSSKMLATSFCRPVGCVESVTLESFPEFLIENFQRGK